MASYIKRKSGWQVRFSRVDEQGKLVQVSKSGFATKDAAKKFAAELELAANIKNEDKLFADYFTEWHKTYKQGKVAPSTYRKYLHVDKVLHTYFPTEKLANMTRQKYQLFINEFGATHSKELMSQINIYVRGCVKSALYDELLKKDFTERVELSFNRQKTKNVDYLNVSEIKQLIQVLTDGLNPKYTSKYMILTAIYTGMRLGEIAGLTWKDIDFMHQTISVNKSYSYVQGELKEPKNRSSKRVIAVNQGLLSVLKQLRGHSSVMVFANEQNTIPTSNAVNKALRVALAQCNLDKTNYHFHSLRHSHVAFLLYQGIDLYAISKRLGHADLTTTMKKYAYLIQEYEASQNKQIANKLQMLHDF